MHRSVVVLALFLLAMTVPAQAQNEPFLSDGSSDVKMYVAGQEMAPPAGGYGHMDLQDLNVVELNEGIEVTLRVAELPDETTSDLTRSARYNVHFAYGGYEWELRIYRSIALDGTPNYWSNLAIYMDGEWAGYTGGYDVTVDTTEATMTAVIERDDMFDVDGKSPGAGDLLADWYVEANGFSIYTMCTPDGECDGLDTRDRMPDDDVGGSIELAMGVVQEGDAFLFSEAPYRISNGGATTLVYEVEAFNAGERQNFRLALENIPDGWDVSLPFDRIVIDEDDTESFPILLTTPSGHKHGGADGFLVTMTGERDSGDVGRLEMGIRYTDIPQPAGHHSRLFFHSNEPYNNGLEALEPAAGGILAYRQGYFNALEEDPADSGKPIHSWSTIPGIENEFHWYLDLQPRLQIGLDFDITKQGTITMPFEYDYIAQDVTMSGTIYYWADGDSMPIGKILETAPVSWQMGVKEIDSVIEIDPAADFLEYTPYGYLYMDIEVHATLIGVGPFGPGAEMELLPGGFMDLPLNEYRDPVDKFYDAVESLAFDTDYLERPVNAGDTIVFEAQLRNSGKADEQVKLNITGVNDEWAKILGADSFTLKMGETRDIAVALVVPAGSPDGALADIVLQAVSEEDPLRRAVIDLIGIVDEEADHPDESDRVEALDAKLQSNKESPGFEIAAVLLGLLALVLVLRRR